MEFTFNTENYEVLRIKECIWILFMQQALLHTCDCSLEGIISSYVWMSKEKLRGKNWEHGEITGKTKEILSWSECGNTVLLCVNSIGILKVKLLEANCVTHNRSQKPHMLVISKEYLLVLICRIRLQHPVVLRPRRQFHLPVPNPVVPDHRDPWNPAVHSLINQLSPVVLARRSLVALVVAVRNPRVLKPVPDLLPAQQINPPSPLNLQRVRSFVFKSRITRYRRVCSK